MTLTEFTRSLDLETLPRILQIQSGIYFQGTKQADKFKLKMWNLKYIDLNMLLTKSFLKKGQIAVNTSLHFICSLRSPIYICLLY